MRQGFSRRSWLLGVFSGLAGLAGLQRRATAAPTASRPEGSTPAFPTTEQWYTYQAPFPSGSVTTHVYDAKARLTTVYSPRSVTTYTYYYDPEDRLT